MLTVCVATSKNNCPARQLHHGAASYCSSPLEPGEYQDAQQVAQVQAVGGGVKAAVDFEAGGSRQLLQLRAGDILHQAPLPQQLYHVL